ncbi:MAG: CheR family methyltransferase [Acidimicrobiales bacterium]
MAGTAEHHVARTSSSALLTSQVSSSIEQQTGLELGRKRLDLLVGWLNRRAETLAMRPQELFQGLFDAEYHNELATVIALITNKETSFFRGERQLRLLDSSVLRPLLEGDTSRPIRLWSAACSTGEEALTLGMIINDHIGKGCTPGVDHPPVEIVGSDICVQTLRTASRMRYSAMAETRLGRRRTDRYFNLDGSALVAERSELPLTVFHSHNLIRPSRLGPFDVIVVRNVFFYMSTRARTLALKNLEHALVPGGVVVFGANDGINVPAGFEPIGAHCYRRRILT